MTQPLSRVSTLSIATNLLRCGIKSIGTVGNAGAGNVSVGDTQHLLGGGPTDDDGEVWGLLRDGPERPGDGKGDGSG
ncbi:hypothetical protein Tco_0146997, partial [Tanacetum coccineum]